MMKMKHSQVSLTLLLTLLTGVAVGFPLGYEALFQPALAQTREEDRKAEADRLFQQGLQQARSSQIQAAINSWEAALKIYREINNFSGEVNSLDNLGFAYRFLGQYQRAIEYHQQSLEISREIGDRKGESNSLSNLGISYRLLRQYPQAIEYYQQSLEISREIGDRKGESDSLNNLGIAYHRLGQYQRGIEYLQQSLEISREISDLNREISSLSNLASAHCSLGQYQQVIKYYQQSLEISRKLGNRSSEGKFLGNLGNAYLFVGQYQQAIEYHQQSLDIKREIGDRYGVGYSLDGLGDAYLFLGQYQQAIEYHQQSLKISREIGDRLRVGKSLNSLGAIYSKLAQYQQAIAYYQQSLEISREIGDRSTEVNSLNNLGVTYESLGQYQRAIAYHQQSLKSAREIGERSGEGRSLGNLGGVYHSLGQYQRAIAYHQQSLEIFRETGDRLGEGQSLGSLGNVYHSLGQYQQAIAYHQQSLEIEREIGDRLGVGSSLNNLGNVYNSLGQYQQAIKYFQQSLQIFRETDARSAEGTSLNNLGFALFKSGNLSAAEKNLLLAIEVEESIRADLGDDTNKVSIFDTQTNAYRNLQRVLIAQNKTNTALEISERGRAKAFVELLAQRVSPNNETPLTPLTIKEIKRISQEQDATIVEYSRVSDYFEIEGKQQYKESELYIWVIKPTGEIEFRQIDLKPLWQQQDTSLQDTVTTARESIARDGTIPRNNPVRGTSNLPDLALGDFVRQKDALPNSQPSVVEAVNLEEGTLTISHTDWNGVTITVPMTDVIKVPSSRTNNLELQRLHQLLIEPIADLLPTDPESRVIFIPQDSLFLVPFPALQDAEGKYLIEKHTILTAPAIEVLGSTRKLRQKISVAAKDILVVGNPLPNRIGALEFAEKEAIEIAKMLDTNPIIGPQATEEEIVARLPQARLIHLAAHGILDNKEGIESGIALASTENNDGLLTAAEIFDLELSAELVVLSACNTGRGKITGDGVIGLSRSLITAGVPSVIVSLWSVPDAPTAELMKEFYQNNLHKGMDKATSLRQAMLTMMKDHPAPRDWAAFTLIGEAE